MQTHILVFFIFSVALTDGFFFGSKCPIKKYKSSNYITGNQLLVHEDFKSRVAALENVAKNCRVHIYVTGSYYQLQNPSQQVPASDVDIVIGHAFQFELRDENNGYLCNKLCLSKNPMDLSEVSCFLQGAANNGLTWSRYNPTLLSDNTYASNTYGYQSLKTDIQTKCAKETFKRELLLELRHMYEEQEQESDEEYDNRINRKK